MLAPADRYCCPRKNADMIPGIPDAVVGWFTSIGPMSRVELVVYGGALLLVFTYLVVWPAVRARIRSERPVIAVPVPDAAADGGMELPGRWIVVCPRCGGRNEFGYTYCHRCVRQLSPAVKTRHPRRRSSTET